MRNESRILALVTILGLVPGLLQAQGGGWADVDRALGRPGKPQPGEVEKYTFLGPT